VEGEVPETRRHLFLRTTLFEVVRAAFGDRATVGSEQFVFWDPTDPNMRCAPDVFVRLGPPDAWFDSWKTWERGAPHVAVEIISASDAADAPWDVKLDRFRRIGVQEVVRFDPDDHERPIRIWDHLGGDLLERDATDPMFTRSEVLDAYWRVRDEGERGAVLRLSRDLAGTQLYPTPDERVRELQAELAKRLV
jgi:Uma2 family endonuclease